MKRARQASRRSPSPETVEAIYDAALAPDLWMRVLSRVRDILRLCSAAYLVYNADRTQVDGMAACPDPDGHRAILDTFFRRNLSYWRGPARARVR